jgi:hypothetical protein
MARKQGVAGRSRLTAATAQRSPATIDRILIGLCAVIWLAALGMSVAATVVLVDKAAGRERQGGGSQTPWLLYAVIGISVIVIVCAIPMLVRARRTALTEPRGAFRADPTPRAAPRPGGPAPRVLPPTRTPEAPTEKLRVFGSIADPLDREPLTYRPAQPRPARIAGGIAPQAVDRMWLRATVVIAGAMGAAVLAVVTGTYLMGVDTDSGAWIAYGVAALITVAMPFIPWNYLRQLRATFAAARSAH